MYVPAEQAQHYAALGYEVVDDLRPNEVFLILRVHEAASKAEVRDGP
jgi:hypothetical protein